jgi:hypothetical protein
MNLSGLKEKINGILENIRGISGKNKMPPFFSDLAARFSSVLDRHFGPEIKKPLLIGSGALIGIFLILVVAAGVSGSKKKQMVSSEAAPDGLTIAMEELFIPAEPDFVPEFIFEREKRRFWSLEDIRLYWRTPDSGDRWKEEIKLAVDKLMDGIP